MIAIHFYEGMSDDMTITKVFELEDDVRRIDKKAFLITEIDMLFNRNLWKICRISIERRTHVVCTMFALAKLSLLIKKGNISLVLSKFITFFSSERTQK